MYLGLVRGERRQDLQVRLLLLVLRRRPAGGQLLHRRRFVLRRSVRRFLLLVGEQVLRLRLRARPQFLQRNGREKEIQTPTGLQFTGSHTRPEPVDPDVRIGNDVHERGRGVSGDW